ncbi:ATP-dependent 5'-3' DNA helicase [Saccharomycopsis crataegensis]|uniref:DNA helicase n=1 Tax=Saccharomycopsis crataegensis TaxID=43959 RepID=A0AAV5QN26_9ASCO|nr:ATP-dependent 5'-3' DNA helicase [Saccharomycopsis crataegensis]
MSDEKEKLSDAFLEAVSLERESDVELVNDLLAKLSTKKLSQQGLAILNLNISNIRTGLGGRTVVELANDNAVNSTEDIDSGEIRVGDIIKVEKIPSSTASKKKLSANNKKSTKGSKSEVKLSEKNKNQVDLCTIEGVITKVSTKTIQLAIDEKFEDNLLKLENERVWLVKISNSITYKRMESTMRKLKELDSGNISPLIQLLLGQSKFISPSPATLEESFSKLQFHNPQLNGSQQRAINFALNSSLSIIHGPPGTGKTYTIIELVQQLLESGKCDRILVCGPSNVSVDTIIERLDKVVPYTKLLRIGHPARLLPTVQKHSLDYISKSGDNAEVTNDIKQEISDNLKTLKKTKSYRQRKEIWNDIKFLKKDLRVREKKVVEELILGAQVVVSTLHGASSRDLTSMTQTGKPLFDVLIIDEVSQSLEPQCWIPIISHPGIKKLVLAGDNKQLPPTVKLDGHNILSADQKNPKNLKIQVSKKKLETTLFDRLIKLHPDDQLKQLLNIQYRMNETIMEFSSRQLYQGKLVADASVKDRLLQDMPAVDDTDDTCVPVIWYDTQGGDFPELEDSSGDNSALSTSSKYNENEALVVLKHVEDLVNAEVAQESIGVISPYSSQVSLLKQKIHKKYPKIEISTVDGFQGREKEVILLSLVRSNFDKKIGFLKDERRLNVAITRPKRQLCVVGDMETIGENRNQFLSKWVKWAEEHAEIRYIDLAELAHLE